MATKDMTKAELEAKIAELEARLEAVSANPNPAPVTTGTIQYVPAQPVYTPVNTDVILVYTSDSPGCVRYSQGELMCTKFGEEFVLPRYAFDEIVGKYRHWFEKGILAVSYKCMDVAAGKGLPTDKEYGLTYDKLERLGKMSANDIERLWDSLDREGLKESVVFFFKRKFSEDAPGYRDVARVDTLNRLSNGKLNAERDQLGGRNYISATDFCTGAKDTIKVLG